MYDYLSFINNSKQFLSNKKIEGHSYIISLSLAYANLEDDVDLDNTVSLAMQYLHSYCIDIPGIILSEALTNGVIYLLLYRSERTNKEQLLWEFKSKEVYYKEFILKNFAKLRIKLNVGFFSLSSLDIESGILGSDLARKVARDTNSRNPIFYDDESIKALDEQNNKDIELERALQNQEFTFYLQPKFDLKTNKIVRAEALARRMKGSEVYNPSEFLKDVSNSESILLLDYFILESVCIFLRQIEKSHGKILPITVNLSHFHLDDFDSANKLFNILSRYNISPKSLVFAFPESLFISEPKRMRALVEKLKNRGFNIAASSFSSGATNYNFWFNFTVDEIVADSSFMTTDEKIIPKAKIILSNIVSLAHELGIKVSAAGVDNERQLKYLSENGFDYASGDILSTIVDKESFLKLM